MRFAPSPGLTDLTGRRRELSALRADIDGAGLDTLAGRGVPRGRVLLIAGRPGSGRTALAEELVRRVRAEYPDGLLRVRLTTSQGEPTFPAPAARDLLYALGASAPPGADEEELSARLREVFAGKRAVLLFDDADSAEQVDLLLPRAPGCLVVAVSRGPLTGIPDVRPCTLGGLDSRAAVEMLVRYAGPTRITCDPVAADSVVELCAGQPAALALVGGWLAARPLASVSDAARRLREIPDRAVDEEGRVERPVARAFRLAYGALPAPAARILRMLVLAPDATVDALSASALAGCSVPTAHTTLEEFVAHGLLRRLPGHPAPDPAAPRRTEIAPGPGAAPRYQLPGCLEPLLEAALREEERPQDRELARARMLERTVRQLQACCWAAAPAGDREARERLEALPRALRFPSRPAAAGWLEERLRELREAARMAVESGRLDTLARRLVAALTHALAAHRGAERAAPELYELHQLVLDVARRQDLVLEEAAALLNLGDLDARAGRTLEALGRYKDALEAARLAEDPYPTGRALESIGATYQELRDWTRAADWYGRALSLHLTRRDLVAQARLYARLGAVHVHAGNWGEALREWRAATAASRRLGDLPAHARALYETARVHQYAGRPQEALRTCLEAVESARRAGDPRLQAAVRLRAADALDRLGQEAEAELHRNAAERLLARANAAQTEQAELVQQAKQPPHTTAKPEQTCETSSGSAKD
ncbi:tetratricopeptide repeat protein [Streptomyces palmae]|uniref:tetratricopeptide repeat protein n=1 Tax=Streptomyces palmae TaxID=1701085 RepID=UPI001FD7A815|nr:tetratricopeptide repeat protein [Streptomyces palmae]